MTNPNSVAVLREKLLAEASRMKAKSGMAWPALPESTRALLREDERNYADPAADYVIAMKHRIADEIDAAIGQTVALVPVPVKEGIDAD